MWKKEDEPGKNPAIQPQQQAKESPNNDTPRSARTGDRANIGGSITIKGDITGDEDLFIQGCVEGSIELKEHAVTISPEGRVKADVRGRVITVQGRVEGDLFGKEQVILSPSCRVRGNITAPRVALEDGASFRGTIDMEANPGEVSPIPGAQRTADPKPKETPKHQAASPAGMPDGKGEKKP